MSVNLPDEIFDEKAAEKLQYTTAVEKTLLPDIDLGALLVQDNEPTDIDALVARGEDHLREVARMNTQCLINMLWELPTHKVQEAVVAALPKTTTAFPREKPIPKEKPLTRWQQYANTKGVQQRKRAKMVWDETDNQWKPRYGFGRANQKSDAWVLEVPDNANPYEDQFEKFDNDKKERVAKNEYQRLKNIARASKVNVSGGILPQSNPGKEQLHRAMTFAKRSTASVGRYTEHLPSETVAKHTGGKRKFESTLGDINAEKAKQRRLLDVMYSDRQKVDVTQAANQHLASQERQKHTQRLSDASSKSTTISSGRKAKSQRPAGRRKGAHFKHGSPTKGKRSFGKQGKAGSHSKKAHSKKGK